MIFIAVFIKIKPRKQGKYFLRHQKGVLNDIWHFLEYFIFSTIKKKIWRGTHTPFSYLTL